MDKTLTTKRCLSSLNTFFKQIEETYERAFSTQPADDQFWTEAEGLTLRLRDALAVRPLGALQIRAACTTAIKAFTEACVGGRARGQ
ncbi:MAG: hypothetical protein GY906_23445 [bacterium]|nr:hypothetical protein [bacterium]